MWTFGIGLSGISWPRSQPTLPTVRPFFLFPLCSRFFGIYILTMIYGTKAIGDLSGGERQRLGIALCAALGRPIWLLDEPLSALDESSARAAADLLAGSPATVLAISHHPGLMDSGAFREERF